MSLAHSGSCASKAENAFSKCHWLHVDRSSPSSSVYTLECDQCRGWSTTDPAGSVRRGSVVRYEGSREELHHTMVRVLRHPVENCQEIGRPRRPGGLLHHAICRLAERSVLKMYSRRRAADTAGVCRLVTGDPGCATAASTTSSGA